jgi:hypothetical protein
MGQVISGGKHGGKPTPDYQYGYAYDGYNNWGEHGPSEPASREVDMGLNRCVNAESFVTGKYPKMLQAWLAKCRCHCGENWP